MADKKTFDIKSKEMRRIEASVLTNPILASYTTSFVRCLIGECLHNAQTLKGVVVSVTTDGFITNLPDLESRILELKHCNTFLKVFKNIRRDITDGVDERALELKATSKGIIS